MSKPRYDWWGHAKGMIRRYPRLKQELSAKHEMGITTSYGGVFSGHELNRATENIAIRELQTNKQREYEAVRRAISCIERRGNGADKLKLISMVFWEQTHTLTGAANVIHIEYRTAVEWHKAFVLDVGRKYGYLD